MPNSTNSCRVDNSKLRGSHVAQAGRRLEDFTLLRTICATVAHSSILSDLSAWQLCNGPEPWNDLSSGVVIPCRRCWNVLFCFQSTKVIGLNVDVGIPLIAAAACTACVAGWEIHFLLWWCTVLLIGQLLIDTYSTPPHYAEAGCNRVSS